MARILSEEAAGKTVRRRQRPSRLRILAHPSWPYLAAFSGLMLGPLVLLVLFVYETYFAGWEQLSKPPGEAIQIVGYDDYNLDTAYIRTTMEQVYACTDSDCTIEAEWPPPYGKGYPCNRSHYPTPEPPGKISTQQQYCYDVEDGWGEANVIILEDGTIWHWNHTESEFDGIILAMLSLMVCGIVSPVLGLIFGLFAVLLSKIYKAW